MKSPTTAPASRNWETYPFRSVPVRPPGRVTTMSWTLPGGSAGAVALICVAESTLTFAGDDPGEWVKDVAPQPKFITVREHYSLVQLPDGNCTR